MACIFCKIIKGEIPSFKIAESALTYCFMDIGPLSKGHCLVIPKECQEKAHQLSEASMADVGVMLSRVAKGVGAEDYNILQNNGKLAHQEVMHVHFHVIPKTSADDGLGVKWAGLDPAPSMDDTGALAKEIAARIEAASQ
jgi:diadenosine tetraphosphate (Ap4A) HIT family hydrolase